MKNFIKSLLKGNPVIEKYARFLNNRISIKDPIPKKKIRGKNNKISINNLSILNKCVFDIIGDDNEIEIQESTVLNNVNFYILGNSNKIKISNNVRFNRSGTIWIDGNYCRTNIGEYTSFEDVHIAVTEPYSQIDIGKDCMFAYDIDLRTGDSHSIIDSKTNKRLNYAQNIDICDHVWIASHVSILKGVKILNNSIVATRSVVTKSFENENIIIGGTPAKKIKENINWDRERIYN